LLAEPKPRKGLQFPYLIFMHSPSSISHLVRHNLSRQYSSIGSPTAYGLDGRGFAILVPIWNFPIFTESRLTVGSTQLPIQCSRYWGTFTYVKNVWCFTSISPYVFMVWKLIKQRKSLKLKNSVAFSQQANYTDRATAVCRRSYCQLLRIEGVAWSAQRIPTAVRPGAATFPFK
jgi:hypothetical protein